jgi:formamidopyrimidine-DNA glycosylase
VPELPEVEVVRRGLQAHVLDRVVAEVSVRHPRAVRRHEAGSRDFAARLRGQRLGDARRRGKYLWVVLADGPAAARRAEPPQEALLVHLGMSGQLLVQPPESPPETHLRVLVRFADGGPDLRFVDQRTFGGLAVVPLVDDPGGRRVPGPVAHIALDPLDPDFDVRAAGRRIRRSRSGVKRLLLDQGIVSGIGNIYADEALWRARIHGERPGDTLPLGRVVDLLGHAAQVMTEALGEGGTSFDALYVNVNGQSGYFDRSLAAYGQEGRPCPRCGTAIRRSAFMNRSSHFCPRCQRAPRVRPSAAG